MIDAGIDGFSFAAELCRHGGKSFRRPDQQLSLIHILNNFNEFTMLDARGFAKYIGFTEEEVKTLCDQYHRDFEKVKRWYDGYLLENCQVYNPKAVVEVLRWNKYQSYWSRTGTYDAIVPLINMDFDGLKTAVITMPVSYTHLDVYKRQLHRYPLPVCSTRTLRRLHRRRRIQFPR